MSDLFQSMNDPTFSSNALKTLEARYLKRKDGTICETPKELLWRVAHHVAQGSARHRKVDEVTKAYYNLMVTSKFLPNSPTLMNAGRELGCLSACFVLPLEDDCESIFKTNSSIGLIQRAGGGTGISLDNLRPCGTLIKSSGGTTSGPITFWRMFNAATEAIQQGCFVKGTKIGTPSGPKNIENIKRGDLVYSYDTHTKQIVLSKAASDAFISKRNVQVYKLVTDKGLEVLGTPEHLVLNRNSEYVELQSLTHNTRIMPLTRFIKGDEAFIHLQDGMDTRIPEHRLVAQYIFNDIDDKDIHHIDNNHLNNDPSNLEPKTRSEHMAHHGKQRGGFYNKGHHGQANGMHKTNFWANKSNTEIESYKSKISNGLSKNNPMYQNSVVANHPLFTNRETKLLAKRGKIVAAACKLLELNCSIQENDWSISIKRLYNTYQFKKDTVLTAFGSWDLFLEEVNTRNHKVLSVTPAYIADEVWDFEVEKTHNFCVVDDTNNGIVVHNSFRRGANMGMMSITHPDILKFIFAKQDLLQFSAYNISIKIDDEFMKTLEDSPKSPWKIFHKSLGEQIYYVPRKLVEIVKDNIGKRDYRGIYLIDTCYSISDLTTTPTDVVTVEEIFDIIIKNAHNTGEPGLFFIDIINQANPTPHIGRIEASNPCGEQPLLSYESCLTGDTLVLTTSGVRQLKTLTNSSEPKYVYSANNRMSKYSKVISKGIQPVFNITLENQLTIRATSEHKFEEFGTGTLLQTSQLEPGTKLRISSKFPGYSYTDFDPQYEMMGWMHGDGWFTNAVVGISFNFKDGDREAKDRLLPYFLDMFDAHNLKPLYNNDACYQIQTYKKSTQVTARKLGFIPGKADVKQLPSTFYQWTLMQQLAFLRGLFGADGSINGESHSQIFLASTSRKLLEQIQPFLASIGIQSRIFTATFKQSNRKSQHKLCITKESANQFMHHIGVSTKHKQEKFQPGRYKDNNYYEIIDIVPDGNEEVFDIVDVEDSHMFYANGIATHNCTLGSINLTKFYDPKKDCNKDWRNCINWKSLEKTIRIATMFLDDVITINRFPLLELTKMAQGNRKIGLGVMGFADLLFNLQIPYGSEESLIVGSEIMKFVSEVSHNESSKLAEERGVFPNWEGSIWHQQKIKMRNAATTTVAPTGTLSILADCSGGIEPVFSLAFERKVLEGKTLPEINKHFIDALGIELRGDKIKTEQVIAHAIRYGSIQDIDFLSKSFKNVFTTAHDIPVHSHVDMQAAFQKYTDSSISKTVNLPFEATPEDVKRVYIKAYRSGCKGITIYRNGSREGQPMALLETSVKKAKKRRIPAIGPEFYYRFNTPSGELRIHIRYNPLDEKDIWEVYATSSSGATEVYLWADAVCSTISIGLRHFTPVEAYIRRLNNFVSPAQHTGMGPLYARSGPQAVARALEYWLNGRKTQAEISEYYGSSERNQDEQIFDICPKCGQPTFGPSPGCRDGKRCRNCDHATGPCADS
ncbi:MAG: ribonucleotide reductase N-terminal alpha domain-containing protein [Candidatus Saccharimonadales bacterium]